MGLESSSEGNYGEQCGNKIPGDLRKQSCELGSAWCVLTKGRPVH